MIGDHGICYSSGWLDPQEYCHGPTACPPSTRSDPRTPRTHADLTRVWWAPLGGLQDASHRHHPGRHRPAPTPGPPLSRALMPPPCPPPATRARGRFRPPRARIRPRHHRPRRDLAPCPAPQRPRDPCRTDPPRRARLPPDRLQPPRSLRRSDQHVDHWGEHARCA